MFFLGSWSWMRISWQKREPRSLSALCGFRLFLLPSFIPRIVSQTSSAWNQAKSGTVDKMFIPGNICIPSEVTWPRQDPPERKPDAQLWSEADRCHQVPRSSQHLSGQLRRHLQRNINIQETPAFRHTVSFVFLSFEISGNAGEGRRPGLIWRTAVSWRFRSLRAHRTTTSIIYGTEYKALIFY